MHSLFSRAKVALSMESYLVGLDQVVKYNTGFKSSLIISWTVRIQVALEEHFLEWVIWELMITDPCTSDVVDHNLEQLDLALRMATIRSDNSQNSGLHLFL